MVLGRYLIVGYLDPQGLFGGSEDGITPTFWLLL